jgi:hypothetical protein
VRHLAPEQHARRAHVVARVDEQEHEVAHAPQQRGEHDQPARLGDERRDGLGALLREPGGHLGDEQQHEHDGDQPEELRQVAQPGVRLDVRRAHAEHRVETSVPAVPLVVLAADVAAVDRGGARAATGGGRAGRGVVVVAGHPPSPEPSQRAR